MSYQPRRSLVTGASSGIGAAFARRLAARGSDLVLVARRADRLDALAEELRAAHRVRVDVHPADLAKPGAGRSLRTVIEGDVDTVINNAGLGAHGPLAEADPETLERMIAVDVAAVVDVTRAFLPPMIASGSGAIVNVASTAAFQAVPLMAVYGASKAFVLSFTEAVWHEARPHGVRVTALAPGFTDTEFFDVAGNAEATVGRVRTPDSVAAAGLHALDRRATPPHVVAGVDNAIGAVAARLSPRRLVIPVVGRLMRLPDRT
jgi:short-subunit dehydrogenase